MNIRVIGGGLAGCEAAWQIAKRGIPVKLFEMKPNKRTPAHSTDYLGELVCSNSLKASRLASAAGMLKQELRELDSLIMSCADNNSVPAGGALAVDRELFAKEVSERIKSNPLITLISEEITQIPDDGINIIATGPLTSDALAQSIVNKFGGNLSFYDAAAPIVTKESIDMSCAFSASRYGKGSDDYINCPMNKEEYEAFYQALINGERAPIHGLDIANPDVYEGCMPIEVMAKRGIDTIRFGPMKPVGLRDPKTGHRPWAVLQLRKENSQGSLLNLVGFQTNLRFPEQKRIFSMIPALKNAEFVRYGVMHRNSFINSVEILNADYSTREDGNLFFAGQLTGVEGYIESVSSGAIAGINASRLVRSLEKIIFPKETMIGALASYISDSSVKNFQPMGANIGILPPLDTHIRDKHLKAEAMANRSLEKLGEILSLL